MRYAVLLLALLVWNPATHAANRKARPVQKTAPAAPHEDFQKHLEQEIGSLKEDVYTRATWKKLQEVKQEADDTAGNVKVAMFTAGGVGFVLGCVVTFLFARRSGVEKKT